jgi:ATP adenylyltransferase
MEYILSDKETGCFLCDLVGADPSQDNLLLYRTDRAMVLMNRFPYTNGHILVAPIKHTSDPAKLGREEYAETMELFRFSLGVLEKQLNPEGFNAGLNLGKSAGAGLEDHLHWHIVPRWQGDTNFMPVIGDSRVIPEAVRETYTGLVDHFREFSQWREEVER